MGCFDSVYKQCSCGGMLEWQSKAGDCSMTSYKLDEAPAAIKADLIGQTERCDKCGSTCTIRGEMRAWFD